MEGECWRFSCCGFRTSFMSAGGSLFRTGGALVAGLSDRLSEVGAGSVRW